MFEEGVKGVYVPNFCKGRKLPANLSLLFGQLITKGRRGNCKRGTEKGESNDN